MRRLILIIAVCVFLVSPALADPYVNIYYGPATAGHRTSPGGEFTSELVSGWTYDVLSLYADSTKGEAGYDNSFQTFCLETNEYLAEDGHTYKAVLNDAAYLGGSGGPDPDPISVGTAWLYTQFAKGTLAGYNYTPGSGRAASAWTLQNAIWALEQEITAPAGNTFYNAAVTQFVTAPAAMADNGGQYAVKAMNLYGSETPRQDQLVLVPVPAAVLLGFLGLGYAGLRLRKMA